MFRNVWDQMNWDKGRYANNQDNFCVKLSRASIILRLNRVVNRNELKYGSQHGRFYFV
jgi:hypothetical protein